MSSEKPKLPPTSPRFTSGTTLEPVLSAQSYARYDAGIAGASAGAVVAGNPELAAVVSAGAASAAGIPPPPPPELDISGARTFAIIAAVSIAMAISGAGGMALSIALPDIQRDLHMEESQLQWVSSAFALTNGCFLLLSGRVADVYGRKLCFVIGLLWNAVWTLVGGFMKSAAGLVVTRALAGMGSALFIPSAVGVVASTFSGRTRATAFASFSAGAPIGGALGMVLGGLLTAYTTASWRASLYTLAGATAACGVAGWLTILPDRGLDPDRRIDWIGAAVITVGLVLFQFSISDGESAPQGWKTPYIIVLLILSVFFIATFFFWENYVETKTTRPPLMRLGLWTRSRGKLAATYAIGCITWIGFIPIFYNATLWYQQVQNTGVIGAMLRFLPCTVSGIICNIIVAKIVHIVNNQLLICVGIGATGLANVLLAICKPESIYWGEAFNAMWLGVLGADFLMAVGSIFVSTLALPEEQSVAGALFQTMVQLGGAVGLAFASVIATNIQAKQVQRGKSAFDALVRGLHGAFWFAAAVCFAALIIAAVMLRGLGTYGSKGKAKSVSGGSDMTEVAPAAKDEKEPVNELNTDKISKV
ncbi:hypothetical protein VHUM_00280 [Vanrija humicola]|uniref:Major facilitator superfamily (MFS) profile domain-containing protein n=1 Tax=Vanrija humicola TaxID=5417 RepID=A0A7D8V4I9_VANHU|nr:hypothetical protein VHUM_00280 [Vanrija humicola]